MANSLKLLLHHKHALYPHFLFLDSPVILDETSATSREPPVPFQLSYYMHGSRVFITQSLVYIPERLSEPIAGSPNTVYGHLGSFGD
jgi:hypothetical protein